MTRRALNLCYQFLTGCATLKIPHHDAFGAILMHIIYCHRKVMLFLIYENPKICAPKSFDVRLWWLSFETFFFVRFNRWSATNYEWHTIETHDRIKVVNEILRVVIYSSARRKTLIQSTWWKRISQKRTKAHTFKASPASKSWPTVVCVTKN